MSMSIKQGALVAVLWMGMAGAAAAEGPDMLPFAIMGGTPTLDLRMRTETVDSDAPALTDDAEATTLRLRLGYTTGKWNDIDLGLEFEDISAADKSSYRSAPGGLASDNGETTRPVIADADSDLADNDPLNQLWVRYSGVPGTALQYGRQRFALDNQRFVGGVAWRQNEQTYDGGTLVNKSLPKTTISYGHFTEVNSVFGVQFPIRADLLNVAVAPLEALKLTAYDYRLDFDDANAGNRQDSETVGLRATGTLPVTESYSFNYAAEAARQSDYGDSAERRAEYRLVEAGATLSLFSVKAGHEELGSDDGVYGLQTPLATLHAHDGWADMFLVTPRTGLVRNYVNLGATLIQKLALQATYHTFDADEGSTRYGDEVDVSAGWTFNKQLSALVKYASYEAEDGAGVALPGTTTNNADTDKGWLQLEYKF